MKEKKSLDNQHKIRGGGLLGQREQALRQGGCLRSQLEEIHAGGFERETGGLLVKKLLTTSAYSRHCCRIFGVGWSVCFLNRWPIPKYNNSLWCSLELLNFWQYVGVVMRCINN